MSDCHAPSEIGGCCIKHYYSNASVSGSGPGSGSGSSLARTSLGEGSSPSANSSPATKAEDERRLLCEELVSTEKSYGRMLKSVCKGMIHRLVKLEELEPSKAPLMSLAERSAVFLNLPHIFELQQKLYKELKRLREDRELLGPQLGKVLLTFAPFFKIYVNYVNNYAESQETLKKLREDRPALDVFLRHCELCEGARVSDLMISPVQRVPRYALLLRAIEKVTPPDGGSLPGLRTALAGVEAVAQDINESFRRAEARARVCEIALLIEGVEDLVTPFRSFVKDGPLEKRYNNSQFKLNGSHEQQTQHKQRRGSFVCAFYSFLSLCLRLSPVCCRDQIVSFLALQ